MTPLNEKINNIISENIIGIQRVPFLTELLNISKESAYRRLRNEVSYTMDEVYILSTKLYFSVDEIFREMNNDKFEKTLSFSNNQTVCPEDNYVEMIKSTIRVFDIIEKDDLIEIFYVANRIPNGIILNYPLLSKLRYIRWIHQAHNLSIDSKFSDIIVSSKIRDINNEYLGLNKRINKTIMVFDENIISTVIDTIKFYYRRHLISEDELMDMKEELLLLTKQLANTLQTGKSKEGIDCAMYLSYLNVESNVMLIKHSKGTSICWPSSGERPIVLTNSKLFEEQRLWINSILKFSVLVTSSNEVLQAELISKQFELIESRFCDLLNAT